MIETSIAILTVLMAVMAVTAVAMMVRAGAPVWLALVWLLLVTVAGAAALSVVWSGLTAW